MLSNSSFMRFLQDPRAPSPLEGSPTVCPEVSRCSISPSVLIGQAVIFFFLNLHSLAFHFQCDVCEEAQNVAL